MDSTYAHSPVCLTVLLPTWYYGGWKKSNKKSVNLKKSMIGDVFKLFLGLLMNKFDILNTYIGL